MQTWTPSGLCHKYEKTSRGDELPSSQPSVHLGDSRSQNTLTKLVVVCQSFYHLFQSKSNPGSYDDCAERALVNRLLEVFNCSVILLSSENVTDTLSSEPPKKMSQTPQLCTTDTETRPLTHCQLPEQSQERISLTEAHSGAFHLSRPRLAHVWSK